MGDLRISFLDKLIGITKEKDPMKNQRPRPHQITNWPIIGLAVMAGALVRIVRRKQFAAARERDLRDHRLL